MIGVEREVLRRRLARHERHVVSADGLRAAAVAALVTPDRTGEPCFLLTRRAAGLRRHGGQYALPGGRVDPGETVVEAALRELDEELAVTLGGESVLGLLDDYATRSGFVITPVVLWSEVRLEPSPDPQEVAAVFEVQLASLDRADVPRLTRIRESDRQVLSIPVGAHWVHAPTAAIVYQLFTLVSGDRIARVFDYEQPVFAWR